MANGFLANGTFNQDDQWYPKDVLQHGLELPYVFSSYLFIHLFT
jgi:hypothetical protein